MNRVFLIGNLVRDPELRTTQSGVSVCTFTIAVNRRKTAQAGQPEADYFRIAAWRQLGENCAKWLIKGKKVSVIGSVSASAYMGNDGQPHANLEVTADDVEFLSPANTSPQDAPQAPKQKPAPIPVYSQPGTAPSGFVQVDEEQLPF